MNSRVENLFNGTPKSKLEKMPEDEKGLSPSLFLEKILTAPDGIPPEGKIVEIYGVEIAIKPGDTAEKLLQEHRGSMAQAIAKRIGIKPETAAFPKLLAEKVLDFTIDDDPASEKTHIGPNYLNAMKDLYPELY